MKHPWARTREVFPRRVAGPGTSRRPRTWPTAILAVVVSFALVGCAGDGDEIDQPEAQPSPNVTRFVEGEFDDIPLYPRANPVGPVSEEDDVRARTFEVSNSDPERILEFYADVLDEWQVVEAPHKIGEGSYRGMWARGDRRLIVSATFAPTLSEDDPTVQYSISLGPQNEQVEGTPAG